MLLTLLSNLGMFGGFVPPVRADTGEAIPGRLMRRSAGLTDEEWVAVLMAIAEA
jgi:hypothetical protein